MKYGDAFYILNTTFIEVPEKDFPSIKQTITIYVIEKAYYISDVVYFNGKKSIQLCSQSTKEIEENDGDWFGAKMEHKLSELNNFDAEKFRAFFESEDDAQKFAKKVLSKDDYKQSKSGFGILKMDHTHWAERMIKIK